MSETLLHRCSTRLKVLTNVFCLYYWTEVILYMCICIVFWMYHQNWMQLEFGCLFEASPSHPQHRWGPACTALSPPRPVLICSFTAERPVWRKAFLLYFPRRDLCRSKNDCCPSPHRPPSDRFLCSTGPVVSYFWASKCSQHGCSDYFIVFSLAVACGIPIIVL